MTSEATELGPTTHREGHLSPSEGRFSGRNAWGGIGGDFPTIGKAAFSPLCRAIVVERLTMLALLGSPPGLIRPSLPLPSQIARRHRLMAPQKRCRETYAFPGRNRQLHQWVV